MKSMGYFHLYQVSAESLWVSLSFPLETVKILVFAFPIFHLSVNIFCFKMQGDTDDYHLGNTVLLSWDFTLRWLVVPGILLATYLLFPSSGYCDNAFTSNIVF